MKENKEETAKALATRPFAESKRVADIFEVLDEYGKCIHTANWERNTTVYVVSQSVWFCKRGLQDRISLAIPSLDDLWDELRWWNIAQGMSCPCLVGKYDWESNGNLSINKGDYILYGRAVDYDGIVECSDDIIPQGKQIGWFRFYIGDFCHTQPNRFSPWMEDSKRYEWGPYISRRDKPTDYVIVITE